VDRRIVSGSYCVCVALVVFLASIVQAAPAGSSLSGSYHVIQKRALGSQMQVVLQLRLSNHGSEAVSIQQLSLQNAVAQAPHWAGVTIGPRSAGLTTQQFTIPRQDYENWRRGLGPVIQLQGSSASGGKMVQTIRLDGFFGGGVK